MDNKTLLSEFRKLFVGLDSARGVWHPVSGLMETVRQGATDKDFHNHLVGTVGLGIVPINSDSKCLWGAIDVDAHSDGCYVDLTRLAKRVTELALPLVVCRSKSAGAHLFLFLSAPAPAFMVQKALKSWSHMLKADLYTIDDQGATKPAGVEIFPKQRKMVAGQVGNWVNLPYFSSATTNRYAVGVDGSQLSLTEFIKLAKSRMADITEAPMGSVENADAPPCIQSILAHGVKPGHRNNAAFSLAVYFKKIGLNVEDALAAANFNPAVFPDPLPVKELKTIVNSVSKGTYGYKCGDSPLCDLCDKELCKTRKFGVAEEAKPSNYDMPTFGALQKILTDPPKWLLEINGIVVELSTEQLMEYRLLRKAMLETVGILAPPMKAEDWGQILRLKNEQRLEISAPEDASPGAMVRSLLSEFVRPVERALVEGSVPDRRCDLIRGLPVLYQKAGELYVCFRGVDFMGMLKRKKAEEFKGAALWAILRKAGCSHDKIRVGHQVIQVWLKPFELQEQFQYVDIKEQF